MSDSPIIFWFRRDLRLDDNLGLHTAIRSGQPVLPLFIIDPRLWRGPWFSRNRTAFMLAALAALDARLRQLNSALLILEGDPLEALPALVRATGANALYFNRDYTPFARTRDEAVARQLGITVRILDDNLLVPPENLLKDDGSPFKVFTPFHRRWDKRRKPKIGTLNFSAARFLRDALSSSSAPLARARLQTQPHVPLPSATEQGARERLSQFSANAISHYAETRNSLVIDPFTADSAGPSGLSPYLRFGILSPRQVYWAARARYAEAMDEPVRQSIEAFCRQIAWREFFMHIMFHFPRVRHGNFRPEFDNLAWRDAPAELTAWQQGRTGYPIVDAAMRQLSAIGWMPNRARMITASFLSKHLLIDWRSGEAHFMRCLLDGDPAANNGGWQWTAGAGTDAQPFFRIFNPILQSRRYDKDGRYIQHWLPELRHLPASHIHQPWKLKSAQLDYPPPIVEHRAARERALAAFQTARS